MDQELPALQIASQSSNLLGEATSKQVHQNLLEAFRIRFQQPLVHLGLPHSSLSSHSHRGFVEAMVALLAAHFQPGSYDLLRKNCNSFSSPLTDLACFPLAIILQKDSYDLK